MSVVTLYKNGNPIEFDSDYLARELSQSGYHVLRELFYSSDDLYRHLCDICETSYHEPIDSLLQNLKNRLA
jgi:hypothetical protein